MKEWAEVEKSYRILFSNFSHNGLILKVKDSNTFKPNLNWNQTRINSNKLFEDFTNL
jgi:hypothetical protein